MIECRSEQEQVWTRTWNAKLLLYKYYHCGCEICFVFVFQKSAIKSWFYLLILSSLYQAKMFSAPRSYADSQQSWGWDDDRSIEMCILVCWTFVDLLIISLSFSIRAIKFKDLLKTDRKIIRILMQLCLLLRYYAVSSYISTLLYSKFRLITFEFLKIKYTNVFLN